MKRFRDIFRDFKDREILQPSMERAVRSSISFMPPVILAGAGYISPMEGVMASFAAHSISMLDVRGTYLLRLRILTFQACMMIGLAWIGAIVGQGVVAAICVSLLFAMLSGYLRHFFGEYGPGIATPAALLLFTAMAVPSDARTGYGISLAAAAAAGSAWGIFHHVVKWPIDHRYPLRFAVGEAWTAVALLFDAMAEVPLPEFVHRQEEINARELTLDQALNQTRIALTGAGDPDTHPFLQPLVLLLHWAGAVGTNMMSLYALLGKRAGDSEMGYLAYAVQTVLTSFGTSARTVARAVVSGRADRFVQAEISLGRTTQLLEVLEARIAAHVENQDDRKHTLELLRTLIRFSRDLVDVVRTSTGQNDPHQQFSFELLDLRVPGSKSLYGAFTRDWHMSRELFRYCLRLAVVMGIGTAVFKFFNLPHGYWIPFSSLVVLQPDFGSTWSRAFQRAAGTLLGSIVVGGLLFLQFPYWVLLAITAVLCGVITHYLKQHYTTAVFIITIMLVVQMEAMGPVGFDVAIERLGCCVLGSGLAFLAAATLWPLWERQRIRPLLADSLRCNRDYLEALIGALRAGVKAPDQNIFQRKMLVEMANADVFDCLRRMGKEPEHQQTPLKVAAVLANGNLRLTRILNALLAGFAPGRVVMVGDAISVFQKNAAEALDLMAILTEKEAGSSAEWDSARKLLDQLRFAVASGGGPTDWLTSRLDHAATELEGMLFGAQALIRSVESPAP